MITDDEPWHGTPNGYNNKRCHCTDCKRAIVEYSAARRAAVKLGLPGECELCEQPSKRLVWDHDHTTMRTRGWICRKCNAGLGLLGDDEIVVSRAIKYLENCASN